MKNFLPPLLCLLISALVLSSATVAQAALKKSDLKAEVVSLEITKGQVPFEETKKYNLQKNFLTKLRILVTSPKKKILNFKEDNSKLLRFDDDQGTNLLKEKNGHQTALFWPSADYYDNKQQCIITLRSPTIPSPKANQLHVKAALVFQCASDKTVTKEAKVTPSAGGSFTLGDTKVEVSEGPGMSFGSFGADYKKKGHVFLKSLKPFGSIASIAFFDSKGKKIKHKETGSGSMGLMGKTEYCIEYELDQKVKTYTIKITYFSDAETVTIPIDQKIGVGL